MDPAASLLAAAGGLALGLSLAAPPGPVNALIAREASLHGPRAGIRAGIAAPVLDTLYMLLVLFGLRHLVRPGWESWIAGAGCLLMLYLAWSTARVSEAKPPVSIWAAIMVTATNPFQYGWWATAGLQLVAGGGAAGVAGFLVAIFGWVLLFSLLMARGAAKWDWFLPLVTVLSADALFVFALKLAWNAAGL